MLTVKNIRSAFVTFVTISFLAISCKTEQPVDMSNPFFREWDTPFGVPPFENIYAKHYMPAFEKGMSDGRKELKKIISDRNEPDFNNTVLALDKLGKLLNNVSMVFYAQAQANTNDSLQGIEVDVMPKLTAFQDEVRMNPDIFKKVKKVYENREALNLSDEQVFYLDNLYKGFLRSGAGLNDRDQDTLKAINQRLSVLTVKFSQNVLAENNNYKLFITREEDLAGLPEGVISAAAEQAKGAGLDGKWAFTVQRPSIFPFLTYAESREKRREIFNAYCSRGNNGNENDNNTLLSDIVTLRAKRARLLGYSNHSSVVLEPRMAGNPDNVFSLLNDLWSRALPVAVKERDELQAIADKEGKNIRLEASDWWYYAEKLRKQKYDLNDEELRQYFNINNVRDGAFEVARRLFGITVTPLENAPLPHPDAQAYEVKDTNNAHLGVLYMDFHPRASKQQGAWCGSYRSHHVENGQAVTPVVTTVFNFTKPVGNMPALISLEEVSTLFHEFGHALDGLLNRSEYNQTFIAWDFVELPSQILEHWATEPEVLGMYAKHYKTGTTIPASLVKKIKESGYFNQGFETVEYLASSLLDMKLHTLTDANPVNIGAFETEFIKSSGLIPEIMPRYRSTYFLHIAGGYDSGYYSYIWAAVLDNDAYEAFRENGIFDKKTASSLRKNILERNGTMDAMTMFVNFRGRKPVIEPLLKQRGLI
jgi:peptidyl-dipeptidase Dcp